MTYNFPHDPSECSERPGEGRPFPRDRMTFREKLGSEFVVLLIILNIGVGILTGTLLIRTLKGSTIGIVEAPKPYIKS